ncbi:hypothetical protein J6590_058924 [Homalodisca vitripennis]|nr:hypothetical protein J6590_058924 [Homalodisca vitripennis]
MYCGKRSLEGENYSIDPVPTTTKRSDFHRMTRDERYNAGTLLTQAVSGNWFPVVLFLSVFHFSISNQTFRHSLSPSNYLVNLNLVT